MIQTSLMNRMRIERANGKHIDGWARLRASLWPDSPIEEHANELAEELATQSHEAIAFVAVIGGDVVGFAEAALRHDHVNGCETSPVVFLEGIYVAPSRRRAGVARALCAAVEQWGRARGCTEMGSDAHLANTISHAFHAAAGFEETERVVFFRKQI